MQKAATPQSVLFSKLHLDGQNPRHEVSSDEPSIIEYLVRHEQVLPLAQDICERGLSPLERLAVIPHPTLDGHFVMVEGNRRLCALKLLKDPAKAPLSERKTFKRLSEKKPPLPRKLDVAVFATRELANQWISLKHSGVQGGIGTLGWNPTQKNRFEESVSGRKRPNSLAVAVIDYAEGAGLITKTQRANIALTTATRYLSNPVVRSALGITSASKLLINVDKAEFDMVLARFLSDLLEGTATSRSDSKARAAYGKQLLASGLSPSTKLDEPISPVAEVPTPEKSSVGQDVPVGSAAAGAVRNNRSPDIGNKVVRSGYAARITDPTTKRVFDELRELDGSRFPFAAAALLRLFMECVCRAYAKKMGLGDTGDLAPVISRCADHMERKAGATKTVFHVWRVLSSNPTHYLAPGSLSLHVHGGSTPVLSDLRRGWTDLEKGFDLMLTALN